MKDNTEYLELFIIVDDTKFKQGQGYINVIFVMPIRNYFSLFPDDDILI